jgi:hypothetical protein
VLALKALAGAAGAQGGEAVRVVAELDGSVLQPLELSAKETATPAALPLRLTPGTHRLRLQVHGAPVAVRVSGEAWAPWGAGGRTGAAPLQVQIGYDATSVRRGQSVLGTLSLTATRAAEVPMVEWGLPAGFAADGADLDALKAKGAITRWERSGRTLRLYLPDLAAAQKVTLPVRFCATAKGELRAPAGRAYEYYRRGETVALAPARFTVE